MRGEGRVCLVVARWGGRGGGCRQESAASAKGPPVCAGLATPSAGPRSIQTQSNKAFPLSSPQNTKQSGEGEGGREGEEGARDGVVGREGCCSASHTNFLTPQFHLPLLLFLSPISKSNHQPPHLSCTSNLFFFIFFFFSSLPILLKSASAKANRLTRRLYFIINGV